jgi:hypothetical protein
MFVNIINYIIRIFFIIFGFILATGIFPPAESGEREMFQVLGVVFIIWGLYRSITFYTYSKRYRKDISDEEE